MKIRFLAAGTAAVLLATTLGACTSSAPQQSGSAPADTSKPFAGTTLTYWATNQGSTLDNDKEILQPELAKFEAKTGIKVNLQVIPWSDMTNNTLQAAVSGQGPDVLNIGNTNATTFKATGAFLEFGDAELAQLGGKDKWVESAWLTAGPPGTPPTSVPLYSQVYGLFYNKALFANAGLQPPSTWEELVAAAKKLTDPSKGTWGIVAPAGTVNVSMHIQYIFAAQNGGSPFGADGTPNFVTPENISAVTRYIDLMSVDKVMNPADAQYTDGTKATIDFAGGKIGMYMAQTGNVNALTQQGMDPSKYGVVPVPSPAGGKPVGTFIAGTNMSIFKNTAHKGAALEFVKFMTSPEEQELLNKAFNTIPPVKGVPTSAFAKYPELMAVWPQILDKNAVPMALVPSVSAYQTNVGGGIVGLFGKVATGSAVSENDVKAMLQAAQQKMG